MSERERNALKRAVDSVKDVDPLTVEYPATVQTQDASGRVSVSIEDGGPMLGASNVQDVYGLPGTRCKVPLGTRGRIAHDSGDPRMRRFGTYDAGCPVTEISIANTTTLPAKDAARKGDTVGCGSFSFVPTPPLPGPIPTGGILFYTPPITNILEATPPIAFLSFVGPVQITQLTAGPLPLTGVITSGSSVVKIGG